jgi:2-dehydropantoate 2-reductase
MKVAICGGGSLGLAYAGLMAEVIEPQLLVRTPDQARQINEQGVAVHMGSQDDTVPKPVTASADPESLAEADVAICLVKYPDTESMAKALMAGLRSEATIISLQTGIRPIIEYREALGAQRVLGGVSYLGAKRTGAASVSIGNNLRTVIGTNGAASEHISRVDDLKISLRGCRLQLETSSDIERVIWEKMVVACSQNAVSGLTGATFGDLRNTESWHHILQQLIEEITTVSRLAGVPFSSDQLDRVFKNWESLPAHVASTFVDLQNRRLTEIDALNGTLVDIGHNHGYKTPLNELLTQLVHLAERAGRS